MCSLDKNIVFSEKEANFLSFLVPSNFARFLFMQMIVKSCRCFIHVLRKKLQIKKSVRKDLLTFLLMQSPMSHKYRSPNELCMDSRQNVPILNKFLQYGIAIYIRDEDQYRSGSAFQTNQWFCLMNQSLRILYAKSTYIRYH